MYGFEGINTEGSIDLSNFAKGIYFKGFENKKQTSKQKIIVY